MLFIDLDLRRPVQSEMLGLSVKQKNELGTLLTESAAPEKILSAAVTDPATGLHSLLSTKSYTDVIELLASDQLAKVVALARERYDYVIIDSPPLGFFSDSELLSDPVRCVGAGGAAGHRPRAGDQRRHRRSAGR